MCSRQSAAPSGSSGGHRVRWQQHQHGAAGRPPEHHSLEHRPPEHRPPEHHSPGQGDGLISGSRGALGPPGAIGPCRALGPCGGSSANRTLGSPLLLGQTELGLLLLLLR